MNNVKRYLPIFWVGIILSVLLSACSSSRVVKYEAPKEGSVYPGHYKIGSPYKVDGQWYYPKVEPAYHEEGTASWYGPGFHGRRTANGDKYNQRSYTAAHRTLPLPSMVRITNVKNGRSVVAMVNDRGPFSKKRIIDVSEKTAIALDMKRQGTAKVQVEFLPQETKDMLLALHLPPLEGKYATATNEYREPEQPVVRKAALPSLISTAQAAEKEENQRIFIQAGAYGSRNNAEKVAVSLSNLGKVGIKPIKGKNGTVYRVRIGPLKDSLYANELLSRVIDLGNSQAIIIGNSG